MNKETKVLGERGWFDHKMEEIKRIKSKREKI